MLERTDCSPVDKITDILDPVSFVRGGQDEEHSQINVKRGSSIQSSFLTSFRSASGSMW